MASKGFCSVICSALRPAVPVPRSGPSAFPRAGSEPRRSAWKARPGCHPRSDARSPAGGGGVSAAPNGFRGRFNAGNAGFQFRDRGKPFVVIAFRFAPIRRLPPSRRSTAASVSVARGTRAAASALSATGASLQRPRLPRPEPRPRAKATASTAATMHERQHRPDNAAVGLEIAQGHFHGAFRHEKPISRYA